MHGVDKRKQLVQYSYSPHVMCYIVCDSFEMLMHIVCVIVIDNLELRITICFQFVVELHSAIIIT